MNGRILLTITVVGILISTLIAFAYSNGSKVINEPKINFVSGTEYWSSSGVGITEKASTIVSIVNYKGEPFPMQSCSATVFYPNKTAYISNNQMSQSSVPGNWYLDMPVPSVEGNYEQHVTCFYTGGNISTSKSFHVNPALNYLKRLGLDLLEVGTNLTNVNFTIHTKVDQTKTDLNTRINTAETNLDNLIDSVYGNLSEQLHKANATLISKITDVNVSIFGKIENSTSIITARITVAETNLNNLINEVNTNLTDKLNAVNADLDATLRNVNMTLYTEIGSTRNSIQTQLTNVNTSLTNLVNTVTNDIDA